MATSEIRTSGGDFTTIAAWESATDTDLVSATEGEIGEIYGTTWAENVTIAGATTNASFFRILRAAAGERHDGTAGGGGVVIDPSSSGHAFEVTEDFFRLEWLRITGLSGTSSECVRTTADETRINHCVFHDLATSQQDGVYFGFGLTSTRTVYISNCIIYEIERSGVHTQDNDNLTVYIHACTFYNCAESGVDDDACVSFQQYTTTGTTFECVNCTFDGGGIDALSGVNGKNTGNVINCTNCATSYTDITAGGAVDVGGNVESVVQADTFVNLTGGSEDLHLDDGVTDLDAAGTDLRTDVNLPVTDDIDGDLREATPDIGAHEFESPAPPSGALQDPIMHGIVPWER